MFSTKLLIAAMALAGTQAVLVKEDLAQIESTLSSEVNSDEDCSYECYYKYLWGEMDDAAFDLCERECEDEG